MNFEVLYERDMLYPTDNSIEPGSIHIKILSPDSNAKIPVIIESKTSHSPLEHIDSIIRIMQSDIFDRIFINIRKNVDIYIKADENMEAVSGGRSHVKVCFAGDQIAYEGVDL
ncbi:MAG: hypothetical protein ACOX4M_09555 [Acetivibrionales bacterium]|jgi:hypothetical protein